MSRARRPHLEVAELIRSHGKRLGRNHQLSAAQLKVMRHVATCRTATLGGHVDECDSCGHQRISYNSCRDRHCPKCQGTQRVQWLEKRLARLLPVPYFHVVFTLPAELGPLLLRNKRRGYDMLFQAAARTLRQLAADPRHLGAEIAVTAVLHTWGQNLLFHPHLHCVVTSGGLAADGKRWVHGDDRYFLPVKALAKLFRGKFLAALQDAYRNSHLRFCGPIADLARPDRWNNWRDRLYQKNWVVYAKPPFGGPEQVLRYLGRYTHRVAISNYRLVRRDGDSVTFTVKDYADGSRKKHLTLAIDEFLRRFLLHVLPARFVRIRHYGLVAGRNVETKLAIARRLLKAPAARCQRTDTPPTWAERLRRLTGIDVMACPACGKRLRRRHRIVPSHRGWWLGKLARASPASTGAAA